MPRLRQEVVAPTYATVEPYPGMRVRVIVHETKRVYGRDVVRISAVSGEGSTWVNRDTVTRDIEKRTT